MAGLDPAIHDFLFATRDVDARDKRGHDGWSSGALIGQRHQFCCSGTGVFAPPLETATNAGRSTRSPIM
jgi:hypothetical protein